MANSTSVTALTFALAALGNNGSGGGGSGGTVSVKVDSTITGDPGTQAKVVNLGNEQEVSLQFTIPQGLQGENGSKWFTSTGEDGSLVDGMNDGDYVLYISGKIYQKLQNQLNYTGITLIPSINGETPYEYAKNNGYLGTEEEFKIIYTNLINGEIINGNNYIKVTDVGVEISGLVTNPEDETSPITVGYLNNLLDNLILNCGGAKDDE